MCGYCSACHEKVLLYFYSIFILNFISILLLLISPPLHKKPAVVKSTEIDLLDMNIDHNSQSANTNADALVELRVAVVATVHACAQDPSRVYILHNALTALVWLVPVERLSLIPISPIADVSIPISPIAIAFPSPPSDA